ncbi:MAG: efflux RND transporter periplasmic adaptor subunit [Hyphomonadaceae bacterium]
MDLSTMTPDETEESPRSKLLSRVKRGAAFAAPLLVVVGGGAAFAVMLATGPKPEEKGEAANPPAVQFAVAQARPAAIAINVQGEARPRTEAALGAQVGGRVVWVNPSFANGGSFREGDTLLRLESADYQLQVVRARGEVAQAQEALTREEAEAELARQDWESLGQGREPSALALREPQLALARAALAAAQASLREAELNLARANIRAPFTGRVRERQVNVGDYVAPGASVATVFATDVMEIRVPLTDADLASLRTPVGFIAANASAAPAAHVSVMSGGQLRTWEGNLVRTEATIDARTRLVYATVEVRDPFSARHSAPLAPGMFVSVRIDGSSSENMIAAPRTALKRNQYVYVVGADNTISIREVRPAQTTADEVLFREGVADGERLVVSVLSAPREGMAVTPIDREGNTAAQPAAQENLDIRE